MSNQKSNSKRQRAHKVSRGENGATRHRLSELEKVLIGKGIAESLRPIPCLRPWRGASGFSEPFDARQAAENRLLYPHLFWED